MNILHLGIKFWPYSQKVLQNKRLNGVRGGGMNKYCDLLINSLPENVKTFVIVQMVPGQQRMEQEGNVRIFRVRTFGSRALRQVIANFHSFFAGIWLIRKNKIDLIHGHMETGIFFAWLLGMVMRKPVIGTPYSFATVGLGVIGPIIKLVETLVYRHVDMLVFESDENRQLALKKRGLHLPNSTVIHTGITLPAMPDRNRQPSDPVRILYIGRLVPIKAIDQLIRAFTLLKPEEQKRIHLDIVGEGELHSDLSKLVTDGGLDYCITLHGYVDDSHPFFERADIFILPSYQEGLSVSLLEAMSYGLACIINDFGVPFRNDSVYEMKNNDPSTIAQAISTVVGDPALRHNLQENARKEIEAGYSVQRFAENYHRVYQQFIHKK